MQEKLYLKEYELNWRVNKTKVGRLNTHLFTKNILYFFYLTEIFKEIDLKMP